MRRRATLAAAIFLVLTCIAHADVISYQIDAPLSDGGLVQAVFNFDTTDIYGSTLIGTVTSSKVSGTFRPAPTGEVFSPNEYGPFFYIEGSNGAEVDLLWKGSRGSQFPGSFCTVSTCGTPANVTDFFGTFQINFLDSTTVTRIVPTVATTPEPSSLALLSTGALGLLALARKRFA